MATISKSARTFVEQKLSEAQEQIDSERKRQAPAALDFDRSLRITDECREKLSATADIDDIATHLRATERALEHLCPSTTKACVSSAIHLRDSAIQGETF